MAAVVQGTVAARRQGARRRGRGLTAAAGAVLAAAALWAAPALGSGCPTPPALSGLGEGALPAVARAIRAADGPRILAIGSSSTEGVGASSPLRAYPPRLEALLERRLPGTDAVVRNAGRGGERAAETLRRLKREVADRDPHLVVWQVGTNDALSDVDAREFAATLEDGVAWLRRRGVDVVLVDPQYFAGVPHEGVYAAFVAAVGDVAARTGTPLLRRYAIMRAWAEAAPDRPMLAADGFHMNDAGYACLAELLADGILASAGARTAARD